MSLTEESWTACLTIVLMLQVIGEEDLASKIAESADTIRRDIIFAASLYI